MSSNAQIMRLSLSDSASLEYVLSDIPFFCVGLTALAVFAFFMVMRRVNLPAIYLYTSSLLAFGAAILDLTQLLIRGTNNINEGLASGVTGLINTREVGLSLAFGFRFLYLWALVAQRPRYEPRPRNQAEPSFEAPYHSASWERWGAPGLILKYALLGSVISIPILQIIWRIATGFSAVYIAESTIQIAVSVLLIAKIMLNLFLSTVAPWWRPFTPYIVPIFALLISTGIGAGNLLFFKFSETTLGRFLQAVETYSLILSMLIFTFYNVPRYTPPATPAPRKRSSFFTGLPPKSEEYEVSAPTEPPVIQIGRGATFSDRPASRESPISRISSWINVRRSPRPNSGEQKLWNAGDAEMGISTEIRATTPDVSVEGPMSPAVDVIDEKRRAPLVVNTAAVEPQNSVPLTPTVEAVTPSTARPFTGVSFASYYGMASNSRLTMPGPITGDDSRNTDSPVYGLNGIVTSAAPESPTLSRRPPSSPPPPESPSITRGSLNSFDELLRQQTELDKSIAALRLFSPTTTVMPIPPPPPPEDPKLSADISGRSLSVSSNRSEFSLSIFPDPPPVDGSILPNSLPVRKARDPPFPTGRSRRQSRIPRSAVSAKDGDGAEPEGLLSAQGSPDRIRFNSAGTQYDVTSFIGDLMIPGSSEPRMGVLGEVAETESDMESPVISTATPGPALRPLLLSSVAPSITSLPPATASSGLLPLSGQQPTTYEYPTLKPLLLGSASGVPSPLSAGARRTPGPTVFNGPRRPVVRGQGRPIISVPRQFEDEQVEETEAFEKPRRPPAVGL